MALRHAVLRLSRPGNQTRAVLLAVGLGAFFIVGVRSLQANLLEQFSVTLDGNAADMFLIDVQPAQAAGVERLLDRADGAAPPRSIPVLRARVTAVTGQEVTLRTYEEVRRRGGLGREFTVTWRDHLQPNERVVEGRFWGAGPDRRRPRCRSSRACATDRGIQLGDVIRFDVLAAWSSARVTSRPRGGLARRAAGRLHVRLPARAARQGAGARSWRRCAARRTRRRAPGCSADSWTGSRTCR